MRLSTRITYDSATVSLSKDERSFTIFIKPHSWKSRWSEYELSESLNKDELLIKLAEWISSEFQGGEVSDDDLSEILGVVSDFCLSEKSATDVSKNN